MKIKITLLLISSYCFIFAAGSSLPYSYYKRIEERKTLALYQNCSSNYGKGVPVTKLTLDIYYHKFEDGTVSVAVNLDDIQFVLPMAAKIGESIGQDYSPAVESFYSRMYSEEGDSGYVELDTQGYITVYCLSQCNIRTMHKIDEITFIQKF